MNLRQFEKRLVEPSLKSLRRKGRQLIYTLLYPDYQRPGGRLCGILKSREEIEECTRYLHRFGFESHILKCKDWDLAHIVPEIGDGNFLDMGSSDSYILKNASLKKIRGGLHGIDLREPDVPVRGVKYAVGDLMETDYPDGFFRNITCLSVIEHEVDFRRFAKESSRLLEDHGRLFVTFDYWEPKVVSPIKMYDRGWQPLDKKAVNQLISECKRCHLIPVEEMDWSLGNAVINKDYYSPHPSMSYTFGILTLEKQPARRR